MNKTLGISIAVFTKGVVIHVRVSDISAICDMKSHSAPPVSSGHGDEVENYYITATDWYMWMRISTEVYKWGCNCTSPIMISQAVMYTGRWKEYIKMQDLEYQHLEI